MAATRLNRTVLALLCSAAVGSLFCASAVAQTVAASPQLPPVPLNFSDPNATLHSNAVGVDVHQDLQARFLPSAQDSHAPSPQRGYELQVTADGDSVGVPVDLSFAHHGNFDADNAGDVSRRGAGSEVRIGRGVANSRGQRRAPTPGWYAFAASDNQAVTWNPGQQNAFGDHGSSFALQDRVEIGDHQAGVTYETGAGIQASLAYVERDVSAHVGNRSYSHDENFAGVTMTMRH